MNQQHKPPSTQEESANLKRTALFQSHVSLGARMVPFAGWEMPVQYTGILAEARAVRSTAGIFDVSHIGRVEVAGNEAVQFLHRLVTTDVLNMPLGRARYALLCNESGGIIDDTFLYRLGEERFILVPNAANADEVLAWLRRWEERWAMEAELRVLTEETAMLALQGPAAEETLQTMCPIDLSSLRRTRCLEGTLSDIPAILARTGYTGEDGFELILSARDAPSIWLDLKERGATPCGLGARDILRLEAGFLLHGSDMDSSVTPLEAGLERFVSWDKDDFVGLPALQATRRRGLSRTLVGFRLLEKGIPRHGYTVLDGQRPIGTVTSGTHSPTLDMDIGLGYVPLEFANVGTKIAIAIRDRRVEAEVVPLPFYSRKR